MKLYVMIFAVADIVAGGPIYCLNKLRFMEENGWTVHVFSPNEGKVYIHGLEKYNHKYDFIYDFPYLFTEKERSRLIQRMADHLPDGDFDEIIIETGTDYTAYWGELLAKKLNARHFIMFLDEYNDRLNTANLPFYKYKLSRNELAFISEKAMQQNLRLLPEIPVDEKHVLRTPCSNSVQSFTSSLQDAFTVSDYNIGYVGRIEKDMVLNIVNSVISFSKSVYPQTVTFVMFGGAQGDIEKNYKELLSSYSNIRFFITGYMWPLPLSALQKMDVFLSFAGSAQATTKKGMQTIRVDVYNESESGLAYYQDKQWHVCKIDGTSTIADCLKAVLIDHVSVPSEKISDEEEWQLIKNTLQTHLDYLRSSDKNLNYFNLADLELSPKMEKKKKIYSVIGGENYKKIANGIVKTLKIKM